MRDLRTLMLLLVQLLSCTVEGLLALSGTEIELAKFVNKSSTISHRADADQCRRSGFHKRNKKRGKQKSGRYPIEPFSLVCVFCVFVFAFAFTESGIVTTIIVKSVYTPPI